MMAPPWAPAGAGVPYVALYLPLVKQCAALRFYRPPLRALRREAAAMFRTTVLRDALRLVTFEHAGSRRIGATVGKEVVDLAKTVGVSDMRSFLNRGEAGIKDAQLAVKSGSNRIPLADVKIKAPM